MRANIKIAESESRIVIFPTKNLPRDTHKSEVIVRMIMRNSIDNYCKRKPGEKLHSYLVIHIV